MARCYRLFAEEYLDLGPSRTRLALVKSRQHYDESGGVRLEIDLVDGQEVVHLVGRGNGPIAALCQALGAHGISVRVLDYSEHAMSSGQAASAAAFVEAETNGRAVWGVGNDASIIDASFNAIVSAANRVFAARRRMT